MLAQRIRVSAFIAFAILTAIALSGALGAYVQNHGPTPQSAAAQHAARDLSAAPLKAEELNALLAPIALYSDTLIAQVLMAATYPLEVMEADRWARAHASLKGDALVQALANEHWDASVKALVQVPTVLKMMSEKIEWTEALGNAFLAQQQDVMASVQRLRTLASDTGCRCLESNTHQTVVRERGTIVIHQASPEVVYVPVYDPWVVYGTWPYPAYPPYFWGWDYWGYGYRPIAYWPFHAGIFWGVGFGVASPIWFDNRWDWHGGTVFVGNWRNGAFIGDQWRHDSFHRRGVDYRDSLTRARFGGGDPTLGNRNTLRARNGGGVDRGVTRLNGRDLSGGRNLSGGRDNINRGGRAGDQFGTGRGGRDRLGTGSGARLQGGTQRGARDSSAARGNRTRQGGASLHGGGRGQMGGGRSTRGGRSGAFGGGGRGGSPHSFGGFGGGRGGGMRGGGRGGGGNRGGGHGHGH